MSATTKINSKQRPKRLVIAGVGNIGSALIPHLARLRGVEQVTIIDHDVYEQKNLLGQNILLHDVGLAKVAVQARQLRRINPSLKVRALQADLHDVPLGLFRADVILACLDSREARRIVNQAAWHLGIPWIDAGISTENGLLARVTVYVPAPDAPCLECTWDERDYVWLEKSQPCLGGPVKAAPTNAPASLGALAAAMQAIECRKLLEGDLEHALSGQQVLLDVQSHTHRVTSFRMNPHCRFNHSVWQVRNIGRGPGGITFAQVLDSASLPIRTGGWVRVEGRPFVRRLQCPRCGRSRKTLGLLGRLYERHLRCKDCKQAMEPVGFEMTDRLDLASVGEKVLVRPLSRMGFRRGDVFSVGLVDGEEIHYEIDGDGK